MRVNVPFIPNDEIAQIAFDFLQKTHPSLGIPVPVEDIVELNLGIDVISVPNLKRDLNIESYIDSEFKVIVIDDYQFNKFKDRAKFTYAHELGHFVLHKELYENAGISNSDNYKEFQNALRGNPLKRIEQQAHIFAGYFLLPQPIFRQEVDKIVDKIGGYSNLIVSDFPVIVQNLANQFEVSTEAIIKQLKYEEKRLINLWFNNKS